MAASFTVPTIAIVAPLLLLLLAGWLLLLRWADRRLLDPALRRAHLRFYLRKTCTACAHPECETRRAVAAMFRQNPPPP